MKKSVKISQDHETTQIGSYLIDDALTQGLKERKAFILIVRRLSDAVQQIECFYSANSLLLIPGRLHDLSFLHFLGFMIFYFGVFFLE